MTEQQLETLEKMFPFGFALVYKNNADKIHTRLVNPKESVTLAECYGAALNRIQELREEAADDEAESST